MAELQKRTFAGFLWSALVGAAATGLCYWIWQDVRPILRPLRGDGWQLLKDLRLFVNVLGVFTVLTIAGLLIDRAGAQKRSTRIVAGVLLVLIVAGLIAYGSYFERNILPIVTG